MNKLFLILIVLLVAGCKVTQQTQTEIQPLPQNITLPPSFLQKGQGLTSEELRLIYSYALEMSSLICERMGLEVSLQANVENNKEKIAALDPIIDQFQVEVDEYLSTDQRKVNAYREAIRTEMNKCQWLDGEWEY